MESIPEEETLSTHAMITDMELEVDSPPTITEPDTKRVRMIDGPAAESPPVTVKREKMMELRPSRSTSSTISSDDAVAHRLRTLEIEAISQHTKHEELKSTAQQLVTALGTAIRRLEDNTIQQDRRISGHDQTLDSHQVLQEQLCQQAQASVSAHQQNERQANQSTDRLSCTEQTISLMMQQYQALQQQLSQRQLLHEEETARLKRQVSELQRPLPPPAQPFPPPIHVRLNDIPSTGPPPPPRPCPPRLPSDPLYTAPESPCVDQSRPFDSSPWTNDLMTPATPLLGFLDAAPPLSNPVPPPSSYTNPPLLSHCSLPATGIPPPFIDSCPSFTPATYAHWKREVRLWIAGYPTGTVSQFLSKIISVLPPAAKIMGMSYMESTDSCPMSRSVDAFIRMLDQRFGKTDSERAFAWLKEFTQFSRKSGENLKDFWARFLRVTTRLEALSMKMSEQVVFSQAIQALKLSESQLPIVLSALETKQCSHSVDTLREITIKMYETHRPHDTDSSEVFVTDQPASSMPGPDTVYLQAEIPEDSGFEDDIEIEWMDEFSGDIFLMKPKRPLKSRNAPGAAASAQKGAVNQFRGYPNKSPQKGTAKGKGKMLCWRCGSPDHFWKDCPLPYNASIPFGSKGKGKPSPVNTPRPQTVHFNTDLSNDATPAITADNPQVPELPQCCPLPTIEETPISHDYPPDPDENTDPWTAFYALRARDDWTNFYSSRIQSDCLHLYPTDLSPVTHKSCQDGSLCPSNSRLPVLIDSGASGTVVGMSWLRQWLGHREIPLDSSTRSFRFGDGGLVPSLGKCNVTLYLLPSVTNANSPKSITVAVDVVPSEVPLLISKQSLEAMKGTLDFSKATLCILNGLTIHLKNLASGHISLPAVPQGEVAPQYRVDESSQSWPISVFTVGNTNELIPVTDAELEKIHKHLAHCSEFTITNLLKAGMRVVDPIQIGRVLQKCSCHGLVNRITPPKISSWIARFNGEIIGIDVVHPFMDIKRRRFGHNEGVTGKNLTALLVVDCMTRFAVCSLVTDCKPSTLITVLLNDWIRTLGKPRRIIMDNGSPGMFGTEWNDFSHTYVIQLINAPKSAPHQNGLTERVVRSLKAGIRAILSDSDLRPSQTLLTQAVMARNHVPHSVTGIPPALAMTGRCDLLAGHAATAWSHNPDSTDPAVLQANAMRNILVARTAVMAADADRALKTCLSRNLPDRSHEFYPLGSPVQIALRGSWVGTWQVVGHSSSNLILQQGRKLIKWPKVKTRQILPDTEDVIENTVIPDLSDTATDEDTATIQRQLPKARSRPRSQSSAPHFEASDPMELDEAADELDDYWCHWNSDDMDLSSHQFPTGHFVNQGIIVCDLHCPSTFQPDDTYTQYNYPSTTSSQEALTDDDILNHFDPSRLPPRIAFRLPEARTAIEKEISDLLRSEKGAPPAMLEVSLSDPRYTHLPRVPSTLVVKRKSVALYKGRLCTRGDVVPLTVTGFMSSPTAHRSAVKIVLTLAASLHWSIRALDISQAFLQSENLRESDRMVVIPPPMVTLPWNGKLPPIGTDLKSLPSPTRGFLLLRPLYGGRDAPMRWFVTLSKRIRSHGFTQLRSDVCMFAKYDHRRMLTSFLICHVDDILFTGTDPDLILVEEILRTFRAGDTEHLTLTNPIIFTGLLIELSPNMSISLSQNQYAADLPKIDVAEFLKNDSIIDAKLLRTALRQALGSLIWLHQTRPDIGYDITRLATDAALAVTDPALALQCINLYNKTVRFVQSYNRKIVYTAVPGTTSLNQRHRLLSQRRLIIFTDAGFGSLANSHSIEGSVTVLGKVTSRDGIIHCHGYLLDHRCAKIQRVCKSSLASEAHAALTASDQALWFQVLLTEIVTGIYDITKIAPPSTFPLPDPFGPSPTDEEVSNHCKKSSQSKSTLLTSCSYCKTSIPLEHLLHFASKQTLDSPPSKPFILFRPLLLTDCCSLFSAILRLQPKSQDKCAKLIMNQLRDLQSLLDVSFIDNSCNLGDIETKHAGSLTILTRFFSTGLFDISFLGRKAQAQLQQTTKLSPLAGKNLKRASAYRSQNPRQSHD